jgi:hypothetical protein
MENPTTTRTTTGTPAGPTAGTTGERFERILAQRAELKTRHSHRLTALMEARADLRGVHALADFVDDAVRWSA